MGRHPSLPSACVGLRLIRHTDGRFHDIAWVQQKDGFSRGLIAGALENGSLDFWDAEKLLDGEG